MTARRQRSGETGGGAVLRVVVANRSALVTEAIRALLSTLPTVRVVAHTRGSVETVEAVSRLEPDVLVVDVEAPTDGRLGLLELVCRELPHTTPVVLLGAVPDRYRARCVELGADLVLDKARELNMLHSLVAHLAAEHREAPPKRGRGSRA